MRLKFFPFFAGALFLLALLSFFLNELGCLRTQTSYQASEAHKAEIATYEAELATINRELTDPTLSDSLRMNLEAKKQALEIQLSRVEREKL